MSSYAKHWELRFKKKRAQQRFTVHGKKRKVLDGIFQSNRKNGERKPVVYGAGVRRGEVPLQREGIAFCSHEVNEENVRQVL